MPPESTGAKDELQICNLLPLTSYGVPMTSLPCCFVFPSSSWPRASPHTRPVRADFSRAAGHNRTYRIASPFQVPTPVAIYSLSYRGTSSNTSSVYERRTTACLPLFPSTGYPVPFALFSWFSLTILLSAVGCSLLVVGGWWLVVGPCWTWAAIPFCHPTIISAKHPDPIPIALHSS